MDLEFQEKLEASIESNNHNPSSLHSTTTSTTDHSANELNLNTKKDGPESSSHGASSLQTSSSFGEKDSGIERIKESLQTRLKPASQLSSSPQSASSEKSNSLPFRQRPSSPGTHLSSSPPSLYTVERNKTDKVDEDAACMKTPERSSSPSQFGRKPKLKAVRQPSDDSEHSGVSF